MAVQKNKNLLFWVRGHKFLNIILLLIISVAAFFSIQVYQKHQNKLAFQQARSAIDFIYADIVAKVGPPADTKNVNKCTRPSGEFAQDPLSCAVGTTFIYAVSDREDATQKYKAIQNVIKSHSDFLKPNGQLSSAIQDEVIVNTYYHSALDRYTTPGGRRCGVKYVFDTPQETILSINQSNSKSLQINIVCTDWAKQQLYPFS